jgi:hypothetical protein
LIKTNELKDGIIRDKVYDQNEGKVMDWTIILTGMGTVVAIAGVNATLYSWLHADIKEIRAEAAADRRDLLQIIRDVQTGIAEETKQFRASMAQETKDFHGRLCAIEERNKRKCD